MDNPKVYIGESKFGKGLFTREILEKDELIAEFDGPEFDVPSALDVPEFARNHAIQIGPTRWKDSVGIARYINHSCEPNVGIYRRTILVAMQKILPGELCFDYAMTERSNWRLDCKCGSKQCRKIIGSYVDLPQLVRQKYSGYISEWLLDTESHLA